MVKMLKQGEVCTECWAWGSVFGLLGVGAFYYDTGSMGRFCTCDWWKRGCRGVGRVLPEFQKRGNGREGVL